MHELQIGDIQRFLDKLEEKMDKRLDRLDDKLDKLTEQSAANAVKLAENTSSLIDHMRRTELLEEQLNKHEKDNEKLEESVEFMVKFPKFIYLFGKWLTMASAVVGFIYGMVKLFIK